jgi:hypothetical protein
VYMGVYYANLSFVQFRAMILGIHVYVYIGYMYTYSCITNIIALNCTKLRLA